VEYLRESLSVVPGDNQFFPVDFVKHVLPLQKALRQFRIGKRQERVQAGFIMILLVGVASYHDSAGTHVESQRFYIILFGVFHSVLQLTKMGESAPGTRPPSAD
jgi:hypothetical protein